MGTEGNLIASPKMEQILRMETETDSTPALWKETKRTPIGGKRIDLSHRRWPDSDAKGRKKLKGDFDR